MCWRNMRTTSYIVLAAWPAMQRGSPVVREMPERPATTAEASGPTWPGDTCKYGEQAHNTLAEQLHSCPASEISNEDMAGRNCLEARVAQRQ